MKDYGEPFFENSRREVFRQGFQSRKIEDFVEYIR